jgi:multidrug efflux pump subunit AcrB
MVFIAILMLGIVSYRLLPIALMPDIDIPEITVQVSYPNSSARELENAIVKRLRTQLMQVAHMNDISSETSDGQSNIRLSFDYGTSIDYAFIEVNEKIDAAMNAMPRDMDRPRVIKASATDLPVFYLNVSLKSDSLKSTVRSQNNHTQNRFMELSEFCSNVISKRIEQLPQVAMVDISGTVSSEIVIKPDKRKMESLNISFDQIQQAVNNSNISPGSIMVRDGYYQYYIRFTSYLKTPADIGNIYIRTNNMILQLKDLAEVSIQPQKQRGLFLTGNKQAITMAIIQQADARMADLKTELNKLIERFNRDYPYMDFEVTRDQSLLLDISISNLLQDLLMGALAAFLVLFLFLNDFRAPVLIGITVPVSLIISLLFFKVFHLSINIISLAGLALGLGMIIDCSIIVIENILYHIHHGEPVNDACIKGTTEVIRPMLSSTLTTSAVFLPLIFLSGMAGALFYDEAVSVSLGNGASFIVAITILPVLFALFYRKKNRHVFHQPGKRSRIRHFRHWLNNIISNLLKRISVAKPVEHWYEHGVEWVFRHKTITTVSFFLMIASNILLYRIIKKEKLPALPQTEMMVSIDWNENIHLDESRRRVEKLTGSLHQYLIQSNCMIGEQQFLLNRNRELDYFQAEIYLKMKSTGMVGLVEDNLQTMVKQQYPQAKVSFKPPETIFERIFSNNEPPLVARISVSSVGRTDPDSILNFVSQADALVKTLVPNRIPLKQQLVINIDQEKLLLYGVDYNTVSQTIKTAFSENQFATLRSYQRFLPIILGEDSRMVSDALASRKVANSKGEEYPLSAFITIRREHDLKYVTAGSQGEFVPLQYTVGAKEAGDCKAKIRQFVNEKHLPDVQFAGSLISNNKMYGELVIILVISVLLLYFILAAQFESLLQPMIVLLEIPANIAGAFFLLWLFDNSINIMSGIGIIVGCGVFINDSIIKVDTINQLRRDGMPLREAIHQGGVMRVGGIIMTAAVTILAVVPFFFGNDIGSVLQKPLSLALIGGMTTGTFVSLFFVPLVYWWIYKNEEIEDKEE